jgi:hypothetical protein
VPPVDAVTSSPLVTGLGTNAPGYDLVLLAHVLTALIGLVAVALAGGSALALRGALARGGPVPEALARYYRPGVNWAGRVLFLVPVLGIALLTMSGGEWDFEDTWVSVGMAAWAVVAIAAEAVLWPTERRLQEVVRARSEQPVGTADVPADPTGARPSDEPGAGALCIRAGLLGFGLGAVLIAVGFLMVAKP